MRLKSSPQSTSLRFLSPSIKLMSNKESQHKVLGPGIIPVFTYPNFIRVRKDLTLSVKGGSDGYRRTPHSNKIHQRV
jgi:hypothetical protein